jgi:geranylgeranyl pyrophosphate synthase
MVFKEKLTKYAKEVAQRMNEQEKNFLMDSNSNTSSSTHLNVNSGVNLSANLSADKNHVILLAKKRLLDASTGGKYIRSSLFLWFAESLGAKLDDDCYKIALAIEFLHSSILIHDDIIDKDSLRRGKITTHAAYETDVLQSKRLSHLESKHYGNSMAICVADLGIFYAFRLLSEIKRDDAKQIFDICATKMMECGFGELIDVDIATHRTTTLDEVLLMYRLKTSSYSFELPFILATIVANRKDLQADIQKIGSLFGELYQLQDDYLNIFGDEKTQKSIGGDLTERKQTFFVLLFFTHANDSDKKLLQNIMGKKISKRKLELARKLFLQNNILELWKNRAITQKEAVEKSINSLKITSNTKHEFKDCLNLIIERNA